MFQNIFILSIFATLSFMRQYRCLNYDDLRNKYDVDNTFCHAKVSGNSINFTTFSYYETQSLSNDINKDATLIQEYRNSTIVLAGNAYKYNLSCNVNDKSYHIGDKHYVIDLILFGPIRQLKAWRYSFNTSNTNQHQLSLVADEESEINDKNDDVIENALEKQISFGWIGHTRLLCIVKKYNYVLNKFTRCEQNLILNVKEKLLPQPIPPPPPPLSQSVSSQRKVKPGPYFYPAQQFRKTTSSSITEVKLTSTNKSTLLSAILNKPEIKLFKQVNENRPETKLILSEQVKSNNAIQPLIILSIFIIIFVTVILIVVYVTYCRKNTTSSTGVDGGIKNKLFKKIKLDDDNHENQDSPLNTSDNNISTQSAYDSNCSSANATNTETTSCNHNQDNFQTNLSNKFKASMNTLDSINSRCSRYIDEKDRNNQESLNEDSLKFI